MMENKVNSSDERKTVANSEEVKILEELYHGNLNPWEMEFHKGSEYDILRKKLFNKMNDFEDKLSEDESETFRKLVSLICEQSCIEAKRTVYSGI